MSQDVVINGTTYPGVEAIEMLDAEGKALIYYPDAVRYAEQTLTEAQKAQARQNIGVPELLSGSTDTITPTQVSEALRAGQDVCIKHTHSRYGDIYFTGFAEAPALDLVASYGVQPMDSTLNPGTIVILLFSLSGSLRGNVWTFEFHQLLKYGDIPDGLPNPNALTFTGAVSATYDGSEAKTIEIPAAGKTPEKGVDYWTEEDQESIVQQVIAALGTPVFGTVDADNNIILTGNLADGTYAIKYEDADGNVTDIGNIVLAPEVTYTNLFDPATATLNTRMSGSSKAPKTENGYVMTARIAIPSTAVVGSSTTSENFVAVPAAMWAGSANMFLSYNTDNTTGYADAGTTKGTVVGSWVKIPLVNQYGNSFNCSGVTLSLKVSGSAITASDIQNIEIYFNEIPE